MLVIEGVGSRMLKQKMVVEKLNIWRCGIGGNDDQSQDEVTAEGLPSTKDTFKCIHPMAGEYHKRMHHSADIMKVFKTLEPAQTLINVEVD